MVAVRTKGNAGRARRRRLYQRMALCFGGLFGFLLIIYVLKQPSQVETMYSSRLRRTTTSGSPLELQQHRQALTQEQVLNLIVNAKVHLVDITWDKALVKESDGEDYKGVYGKFCRVEWGLHKTSPPNFSFFHQLLEASPDCLHPVEMELSQVVQACQAHDANPSNSNTKNLNFTAVVFQESRCGSTLVANMMAAFDATKNRVYSESPPPLNAMGFVCGMDNEYCSVETSVKLLQDVVYLMGRTDDLREERLFFKIQSMGSRHVGTFQKAFPDKPWMFIYRNPVQILMSHFAHGVQSANCLHQKSHPHPLVHQIAQRHGAGRDARQLSNENYCAAHLASIAEMAVANLNEHATAINYEQLPDRFYQEILPRILGRPLTEAEHDAAQAAGAQYSKGGTSHHAAGEFKPGEDSKKKEEMASEEVKQAAATYLQESFEALEAHTAAQKQ